MWVFAIARAVEEGCCSVMMGFVERGCLVMMVGVLENRGAGIFSLSGGLLQPHSNFKDFKVSSGASQ